MPLFQPPYSSVESCFVARLWYLIELQLLYSQLAPVLGFLYRKCQAPSQDVAAKADGPTVVVGDDLCFKPRMSVINWVIQVVCKLKVLLKEECFCIHKFLVSCGHICCKMGSLVLIAHSRHFRKHHFLRLLHGNWLTWCPFSSLGFLCDTVTFKLSQLPSCWFAFRVTSFLFWENGRSSRYSKSFLDCSFSLSVSLVTYKSPGAWDIHF